MRLLTPMPRPERVWKVRESGLGATVFVPGEHDGWEGWEDSAVPPERLGELPARASTSCSNATAIRRPVRPFRPGLRAPAHHLRPGDRARASRKYREFVDQAADLVLAYGGSLSGEHGDGQARGELLPKMYGPELMKAFQEFKASGTRDGG